MVGNALRALWAEPRAAHPPVQVWRDWALVAVVVSCSVVETVLRQDLAWRPIVLTVAVVVSCSVVETVLRQTALTLLSRRTHPLGAVAVAFGTLTAVDVARILSADDTGLLSSTAAALLLPRAVPLGSRPRGRDRLGAHPGLARRHARRRSDQCD